MTVIIRRNPSRALAVMRPFYRPTNVIEEVEAMMKEKWDSWQPVAFHTSLILKLNMHEEKDELVVKAELPGIRKKDFDIILEDDVLTIKAEKKPEEVSDEATYYVRERSFGQYSRSISLPFHVDADKTSATLRNGLLEIRLPKAEEAKSKHIEVKVQ